MNDLNITLIGLGNMGSAIGEKLLENNFKLTVYNRTESKTSDLVAKGAKLATSISQAVEIADVVITALFDDSAVFDVTRKMMGELKKNAIHISTSTILPKTANELTTLHESHGSIYIGAPILGVPGALRKQIATTLVAGKSDTLKLCEPVFKSYSSQVIDLEGEPYKANVMKICGNYLITSAIETMGELYTFAEKSGLESDYIQGLLHTVFAHKSYTLYADKLKERNFDQVNFSLSGGFKDMTLFEKAFTEVGVVPDTVSRVKNKFIAAKANGLDQKDWSAFTEITRLLAGVY